METSKRKDSMKKFFTLALLVGLFGTNLLFSQTIYLPISNDVYGFLKRMESKQYITHFQDAARPLSRIAIAQKLKELEPSIPKMTAVEHDLYNFYLTEFRYELLMLEGDPEPSEIRWHIFSTDLFEGKMNFDLNYWLSYRENGQEITRVRTQGLRLYGYAYKNIGYYFNVVDNKETGDKLNPSRLYSSEHGIVVASTHGPHEIQYDENDAQFTVQLGRAALSLEKNVNAWGYGERGEVIFSGRAPSYPMVKLVFPLSPSINFVYFHGQLNSDIVDSSRSYWVTYPDYSSFRRVDHDKFIAAHQIEFSIIRGIDLSLGESIVYSDRGPLLVYMVPIMFFKAAEHYNKDPDNSQMFGSLDINLFPRTNFYTTLFIDEINTDELFDEFKSRKQIAYTIGARFFDIPLTNVDLNAEYTRANPAVYNHKYPTVTFANSGYALGTWIGQNADLLFCQVGYTPYYKFSLSCYYERYRKGGDLSIGDQYSQDQGRKSFLFGPLHKEETFGLRLKYQPFRDFFIRTFLQWRTITDENDPTLNRSRQPEIFLSAGLGIW